MSEKVVFVSGGKYMFEHGVVRGIVEDLGSHGFAYVNFIGRKGNPLVRTGRSTVDPDVRLPPLDLLPLQYLSPVDGKET